MFGENLKIHIEFFFQKWSYYISLYPGGWKFQGNCCLFQAVKEIAWILCLIILVENSKIKNGRHFWKYFEKWLSIFLKSRGAQNFDKITLSHTVKNIAKILRFTFFNSKIENSWHFWKLVKVPYIAWILLPSITIQSRPMTL